MIENPDLLPLFYRSLLENAGRATNLWLEVEAGKDASLNSLKRLLHTVKGEAHMLGLADVGNLGMVLEELVIRSVAAGLAADHGNAMLEGLEALGMIAAEGRRDVVDLVELTGRLDAMCNALPRPEGAPSAPKVPVEEPPAESGEGTSREGFIPVDDVLPRVSELGRLYGEQALLQPDLREAQRILRAVLAEMDPNLPPAVLGEQVIKTLGYAAEVERRLTRVRAMWSANAHATGLALDGLSESTRKAALVSVTRLRTQLALAARTTARTLGKDVALTFDGDAYIDAAISRRLETALLHAVRNAVDHGLESPEARAAVNKPRQGAIRIHVEEDAGMVRASIRDDGRGVDYVALRKRVGLTPDDPTPPSDLIARLFESGLSTRETANQISGRGVGLDVVAKEAAEAGGRVWAESVTGIGFELSIEMPVVLRAEHVVPLQVGRHQVAIASRHVERFMRVSNVERTTEGPMLRLADDHEKVAVLPVLALHRAFDESPPPIEGAWAIVVRVGSQRAALIVDRSESPRTVSFQPMSELACTSPFVRAIAPLPDGTVRLLLDAAPLLRHLQGGVEVSEAPTTSTEARAQVLVVEDAPVARELLCGILRSFGLQVTEAAHGKEGIDLLRKRKFDLVLTDVEMPFLGGLEMIEVARKKLGLTNLPIIVLTTDVREETRRHASALGVAAFLPKQRFVEDDLRKLVDRYLERA